MTISLGFIISYVFIVSLVSGGWSDWSEWTICELVCEDGLLSNRTRLCDNPEPQNGGDTCQGEVSESKPCPKVNCPSKYCFFYTNMGHECFMLEKKQDCIFLARSAFHRRLSLAVRDV